MEAKRRQQNLITLNDKDGNPLSPDIALLSLIELLNVLPAQDLINTLGEIGLILYENECDKANEILLKKYHDHPIVKNLPPLKERDGPNNFLFTCHAMKLINTLLIFNCTNRLILNLQKFDIQNGIIVPLANDLRIIDLFLLANQLIYNIQNELAEKGDKFLSDVSMYYSNSLEDTNSAIGRSRLLYNNKYFNNKIFADFGMSVLELSEYLFILFALVNGNYPAKIELDFTFRKIATNDHRAKIIKILNSISIDIKSKNIKYEQLASDLYQDFIQDKISRGKPFLKIGDRYVCIRPDLLTSVLANFPYHYVLNSLTEDQKDEFFKEFGVTFEKYLEIISKRVLNEKSDTYIYTTKPHQSNRSADRHFIINDQVRAIVEIKSSRENDNVMLGSLEDLLKKFIHLGGTEKKPKGVLQLIKDAEKYRSETSYNGKIFTVIIFFGNFPETENFDDLVQKEINNTIQYQKYLADNRNFPTIWLNVTTAELIFNAITQKADLEEILTELTTLPPSKIRTAILRYISQKNLRSSLSHLFDEELNHLREMSTRMLIQNLSP